MSTWVHFFRSTERPRLRLFCFPYAGAGPDMFRNWGNFLPEDVDLAAAILPGRHVRLVEKCISDWPTLLASLGNAILPYCDRPFAFYGHSFGARIAFELTKWLQSEHAGLPVRLFLSGCRCPHFVWPKPYIHELPSEAFYQRVAELSGIPADVASNVKLMKMFEPALRADIRLSELWQDTKRTRIDVPLSIFSGAHDHVDPPFMLKEWSDYTESTCDFYSFEQGHFFIHAHEEEFLRVLSSLLIGPTEVP